MLKTNKEENFVRTEKNNDIYFQAKNLSFLESAMYLCMRTENKELLLIKMKGKCEVDHV